MSQHLSKVLSPEEINALEQEIVELVRGEVGEELVLDKMQPLRDILHHQKEAVGPLLRMIDKQYVSRQASADILSQIAQAYDEDIGILTGIGLCIDAARDIDDLNAPPPDEEVFRTVIDRLTAVTGDHNASTDEAAICRALANSARMMARQFDDIAEANYRKLVELDPQNSTCHYNLGLFFKTRGRFEEGMRSNQTAVELSGEVEDSNEWNLGICATGAGHGEVALDVWKRMGQKIEMGRFGLPEGGYPQAKVKLAERPLAERTADLDDPGLEETIWIERLSPCHGIVRSVLYGDLGVNYGDAILFDGAPITYHTYGDEQIAVFPHLATLVRNNYQIFDFAGTQAEARQLADASVDLDGDALVYSHTESYREICSNCWRDPDIDHEVHEATEKHIVTGKIAAPAGITPADLLNQLDRAVASRESCQIYAPDLCSAAGSANRADVERRRFDMLRGN